MKYKKNQYTEGFSICALIIAGMFYYWGIDAFWNGFWSFNINWMGFLWIGIGTAILVSQIAALMNRSKLRNVVLYEFQQNPNAAMEEISNNTGISIRDLRAIILDLKASGRLRGNFSPETGSAKEMQVVKDVPPTFQKADQEHAKFCPSCGTPIERTKAAFCSYCGNKL
jgi:hypothetical protein